MCLFTKNKDGYVSDKPIVCYKIYRRRPDGSVVSFYRSSVAHLNEGDEVVAEGVAKFNQYPRDLCFKLGEGFIHGIEEKWMTLIVPVFTFGKIGDIALKLSFTENAGQIEYIDICLNDILKYLKDLVLCEMEIPAGERYWIEEGRAGMMAERDICARRMIFKKEFKINKKSEILNMISVIYSDCFREDTYEVIGNIVEEYKAKGE